MLNLKAKVLLNRVQYDVGPDLARARDFFISHGIDIQFNQQKTDITGYSSSLHSNTTNMQTQYILDGAKPLVEKYSQHDLDLLLFTIRASQEFGAKTPSTSMQGYMENGKTIFINLNADDQFYDAYPNFYIWLIHEIMHALVLMARSAGFPVTDVMDIMTGANGERLMYYENYDPENVNSNFIRQFELLYPWLKSLHVYDINH